MRTTNPENPDEFGIDLFVVSDLLAVSDCDLESLTDEEIQSARKVLIHLTRSTALTLLASRLEISPFTSLDADMAYMWSYSIEVAASAIDQLATLRQLADVQTATERAVGIPPIRIMLTDAELTELLYQKFESLGLYLRRPNGKKD